MQFTAKAVKQGVVLAVLIFGAAWIGAQVAVKYSQTAYPQVKGYMLKIEFPPKPCQTC